MSDTLVNPVPAGAARVLGLREELVAEIRALAIALLGALLFLSLVSGRGAALSGSSAAGSPSTNLVGHLGYYIDATLTYVLGRYVAYLVPLLVLAFALATWLRRPIRNVPERLLGTAVAVSCVCGMLAAGSANIDFKTSRAAFLSGGALGNFLMHRDCLALTSYLGVAGTYLLFTVLLVISVCVLTDSQIRPTLARSLLFARYSIPRKAHAQLRRFRQWWTRNANSPRPSEEILDAFTEVRLQEKAAREQGFETDWDSLPSTSERRNEPYVDQPAHSVPPALDLPGALFPDSTATASMPETKEHPHHPFSNTEDDAPRARFSPPSQSVALATAEPLKPAALIQPEINLFAPPANETISREHNRAPEYDRAHERSAEPEPSSSRVWKPTGLPSFSAPSLPVPAPSASEPPPPIEELAPTKLVEFLLPVLDLLNDVPVIDNRRSDEELAETSDLLEKTLAQFGISAQVVQVTQGPTVTRFELQPAPGVKVSRIAALENDITMCMKAHSVRIIAPVPGRGTVGLEIPNENAAPVFLREILEAEAFQNHRSPLAFALGKTISGEPYICDLAAMPHLLIAGTTGSGKSVCLNAIICSILFRMRPDQVKFIMIDPKRVELNVYQAIPHLLAPVVCEPRKAAAALQWAIEQMEDRYKKLAALGVRNIDNYNAIVRSPEPHPKALGRNLEYMPHIVIVIDELADLMIIAKNEVEDSIIRLAQMSRAVGMHLILATQRPSVNVITGIIKANFPSRVAFQVSSKIDSRTILDANGAEALLGRGDMLFSPGGSPKPIRLQGCFVTDQEVESVADFVRNQQKAMYVKHDFATAEEIAAERAAAAAEMNGGASNGSSRTASRPAGGAVRSEYSRATEEYRPRLNGIDADERAVQYEDDGGDQDDYTYRTERIDGRDARDVMNGTASRPNESETGRYDFGGRISDDTDAIDDELFRQAVKCILIHRKASVSLLQRKLKIGFARAGRVMDMVEEAGIVGPNLGSKVRDIIVDPDEYLAKMESEDEGGF